MQDLRKFVRAIPDYPKPGIIFRDVTTLFADPEGLRGIVDMMTAPYRDEDIDLVAGIDARGFILGGAMAMALGKGFVPIRKKGKLPAKVYRQEYSLEYGVDEVEIHVDALDHGAKVLLVDDLIATGGTAVAGVKLIERAGGAVAHAAFAIDLPDLGGAAKLRERGIKVFTAMDFEGD
ncbi:adenine phosphoribosyltransferase [Acuticoccus sp. MNP-M23]|uniref:adenine phosphoribosyltransferase n=1 Tax=Acuticoccus sp. MNP-M23 TaxID=3072793 RepID=UPI002815C201|nr:adenine phosphoribosyltransferase [Acuticoccus sp. MNP-M23]WMS41249.1 adenine phosphoribosyltransferase [Acuticoccus sp. MNP-M23]